MQLKSLQQERGVAVAVQGDVFGSSLPAWGTVFELMRQLAKEFSLRSRAEAMSLSTLHHSQGETFASYRVSALRWEHQQRLFLELQGTKSLFGLHENEFSEHAEFQGQMRLMMARSFSVGTKPSDADSELKRQEGPPGESVHNEP